MPWLLLLKSPWTWVALAFAGLGGYAAMQHLGWKSCKADFAQFRADVESLAAEAKVKNAQEAAKHAHNAQEVLSDLQTRHDALSARYASLRTRSGSRPVPADTGTAPSPSTSPGDAIQPDPDARCLAALEWGDRELAKYVELWQLWKKNASSAPL